MIFLQGNQKLISLIFLSAILLIPSLYDIIISIVFIISEECINEEIFT